MTLPPFTAHSSLPLPFLSLKKLWSSLCFQPPLPPPNFWQVPYKIPRYLEIPILYRFVKLGRAEDIYPKNTRIPLFWERLLEKNLPRQPWNVIWDMITTLFLTLYCQISFCCFPLTLANTCPWTLVPFFQISLKNNELTTTHNTFRVCRVHFFWQPFLK